MRMPPLSPHELTERARMCARDRKDLLLLGYDMGKTREERAKAGQEIGYSNFRIKMHEIFGVITGMYDLASGIYYAEEGIVHIASHR